MEADFVLIDCRWAKRGWIEAFRLRLAGWLPYELAASGVDKGVLDWGADGQTSKLLLSARGATLTDELSHSRTEENLQAIAEILNCLEFESSWLKAPSQNTVTFTSESARFDSIYRNSILEALKKSSQPIIL